MDEPVDDVTCVHLGGSVGMEYPQKSRERSSGGKAGKRSNWREGENGFGKAEK